MAVRQKSPAAFVADAEKLNTEPSDSEYESEFDEDDEIRLSEPSENAVYNREGLLDKLGDISWPENVEWIHKLSFDVNQEQEVDVNDDLTREHAFYTQALEGTKDAFLKLKSVGRPFIKPCDYNAPMVKNDTHMEKVKDQLLAEKNRVDESEERRKIREKEKIAKEVQAQKLKEKAKQEKEERKSVAKGRKLSSLSEPAEDDDDDDDDDMESDSEDESTLERSNDKRQPGSPGDHSGGLANDATGKGKKEKDKKRKNRDYRNSKNGIGGKKGMKKQNRAETTKKIRGDVKSSGFFKNKRGKV